MKRYISILVMVVASALFIFNFSWGQCPEDTLDRGECDTLHVVPYGADDPTVVVDSLPALVEVMLLIDHDITVPHDSITGIVIPLTFSDRTNSAKYCSLSDYWNNTNLYPWDVEHSIFRHLEISPGDTMFNWMMSLSEQGPGAGWADITLSLDDGLGNNVFWLIMAATTKQLMGDVSKTLIATMTFRVEDTMTICIDSMFWGPSNHLGFGLEGTRAYCPRHNMPICFKVDTISSSVREIQDSEDSRPSEFSLSQNYPNPFNPVTNFRFSLPRSSQVKIEIFNIVGQKVRTLMDEEMESGVYVVDWDGRDENQKPVSSGIYFYRMQAGEFSDMKKMVLVK